MRVLSVVGNRPQFVKSGPLSLALRDAGLEETVVHTGQHWDPEMSAVFFEELGLDEPAFRLDLRTADTEAMEPPIREAVARVRPDWVLVYGDTNSTLAGARAAGDVPVAHVEAGLRSFDLSMPEERNRIAVDRLAALLLCPDERSAAQLEQEGVRGRREVVGDVMADATRVFLPVARARRERPVEGEYVALTLHREANTAPAQLRGLVDAVNAAPWQFVFPVHPRTRHVLDEHGIELGANVRALEPLGYLEMLALVEGASRVVTDSGGLQKEAYWLGVPCVTLRANTEWVDTVRVGANTLVDPAAPEGLADALERAVFPAGAPALYGDGHASERIAALLGR
ncbi:MAG TPA: UDP-N-acetylglucosamine 2-epimerase (non-hydrolyzing) [Gaiellaceae bacterium]|nr:UDP-N-acetylglucosamine 2-epimerase (non-hydrolyzing) [Gaiellaceae bacterium]